jgi:crotonobetainyl-CoA:carnitine CoA-transferase CaiB-like acyl-CoA transferase
MISAFGPDGPYAQRVGFDPVAQAMSGAMGLTGFPGPPVRSVVTFEDYGTALHAAFGAMAALYEKQKTGRGQVVDTSLLATGVAFMQALLIERHVRGAKRTQWGNAGFFSAPNDAYRAQDGWVMVQVNGQPMFERWARLVGRPDLIDDPRCRDDLTRADHHELINEVMSAWTARRTRQEVIAELQAARIACGPVYDLDGVLADPQVKARELLRFIAYPGSPQMVPIANTPVRLSETPGEVRHRAPTLGEHTEEVLQGLGFTGAEIAAFRVAGAI